MTSDLDLLKSWTGEKDRLTCLELIASSFMMLLYRLLNTIYIAAYFYFQPFFTLVLTEMLKYKNPILKKTDT